MKTAVIYARYSSERQTEQSIEGQLRVCNDYAQKNNIVIVDTYIDRAMTGTNDNRTSFQKMLKDSAKQAWDIVLVYKLDRFSRNKYEMAMHKKTLKDNGIKLVSAMENIPDTPEGIILESLLEGMAEYYSAELSQKVRRGMNESRQKGQYTGGVLIYGYRQENKKIKINEDEAKIVRYIFEKYASGVYVKDIIKELTQQGIYRNGKPFATNTIYYLLRNEKYVGIFRHDDEVFTNIYPQIVSNDVFNIVKQKIESNHYGKHVADVTYLLKNKVICGYCGKTITSESGTSKNGNIKRYYKCLNKKRGFDCSKKPIRKEILEQLIINTTFKIFDDSQTTFLLAEKILSIHNKRAEDTSKLKIIMQEQNDTKKAIDNLISCMEKGIVSTTTKQRLEELENKLENLNNIIALEQAKDKIQLNKEDIIKFIRTSLKKEPKLMIKLLINKIILYDDKVEIYYNYIENKRKSDDAGQTFSFYNDMFEFEEKKFRQLPLKIKLKIIANI